jgi:glucosylceramidase
MNNRSSGATVTLTPRKPACRVLVPALLAVLCGCGSAVRDPAHAPHTQANHGVQVWVTTADRSQQLARATDVLLRRATAAPATIEIDTARRYQTMIGFGAAMTDASAWLIRSRMGGAQRDAVRYN